MSIVGKLKTHPLWKFFDKRLGQIDEKEVLEAIVNNEKNVDDVFAGQTLLVHVSEKGQGTQSDAIVGKLLEHGASVEFKDSNGFSALHYSVSRTTPNHFLQIVEKCDDVDPQTKECDTPLILAAKNKNCGAEIVEKLLKRQANPELKNKGEQTAFSTAVQCDNVEVVKLLPIPKGSAAFDLLYFAASCNAQRVYQHFLKRLNKELKEELIPHPSKLVTIESIVSSVYEYETAEAKKKIKDTLSSMKLALEMKKQIIIQGGPGAGKTFIAQELAKLFATEANISLIQVHPNYGYEDMIEGIRPVCEESNTTTQQAAAAAQQSTTPQFKVAPGALKRLVEKAEGSPCVLIIDEINRCNLPQVFGELFYLLEYREREVKLMNSGTPFKLPDNFYIIGTMNSKDKSIVNMDEALRRRFMFMDQHKLNLVPNLKQYFTYHYNGKKILPLLKKVAAAIKVFNEECSEQQLPFYLGPSRYMIIHLSEESVQAIWKFDVHPYIEHSLGEKAASKYSWEEVNAGKFETIIVQGKK